MAPAGADGRLVVVGTPIGNLDDLSPRAAEALRRSDLVLAEDTRRTGRLLAHLGVDDAVLRSLHDHNEQRRVPAVLERVRGGDRVALVSDAGMPAVSDPGYRLVAACHDAGVTVEVVPGPSAVLHALVASGLPTDRFCFEGFLPRGGRARRDRLAALAVEPRTTVLFVAPHRAERDLADLTTALGPDRPAALARELTKLHEEVVRATLGDLVGRAAAGLRGEVTLVVAGATPPPTTVDAADLRAAVDAEVAGGASRRDAVAAVSQRTGVARSVVYEAAHPR